MLKTDVTPQPKCTVVGQTKYTSDSEREAYYARILGRDPIAFQLQTSEFLEDEMTSAMGGGSKSVSIKSQNVTFHEPNVNPVTTYTNSISNPVAMVDKSEDISLGKFLARPTLIASASWTEATSAGTNLITVQPYLAFFNNTYIRRKIDNFAYMRCKLHVKVVVNSTPFNYGYARMVYNPCAGFSWDPYASAPAGASAVVCSQYPHVEILPHNSQGGEMVLPQLLHTNWYDLGSSSFLQNSGEIKVVAFTALTSANGQLSYSASVQVYAWATDVELMGATLQLALQTSEYDDDGPISGPASAVAAIAGKLDSAPVIGKFARATSIAAGSVASIARIFGYSNPPVIANTMNIEQSNMPHLASSQISTHFDKLTLDPKCELAYDTSFLDDHKEDYTIIENMVKHESLLVSFNFNDSSNVVGAQLFNARVQPVLYQRRDLTGATANLSTINGTPMSHVSQLFQFWRGDIKFRFKFIVSKFHKGRFRITYDPRGRVDTTSDSINTTLTRIVDIGEEDDVTLTIPYTQRTAWMKCRNYINCISEDGNWTPGNTLAPDLGFDNGLITLRIQTLLSAPVTSADWKVLIFVSAGDNLEFSVPRILTPSDNATPISVLPFQTAEYDEDKMKTETTQVNDFSVNHHDNNIYVTNHGETFKSLKALCSRGVVAKNYALPSVSSNQLAHLRILHARLPTPFGYNSWYTGTQNVNGLVVTSATGVDLSTILHPITWVNSCFKGYRGSFHHRWNVESKGFQTIDKLYVSRHPFTRGANDARGRIVSTRAVAGSDQTSENVYLNITSCDNGLAGQGTTSQRNNNSLNVVLPDYNRFNFRYYVPSNIAQGSSIDESDTDTYSMNIILKPTDAVQQASNQITLTQYISGGADYKPVFFLAVPTVYYSPTMWT